LIGFFLLACGNEIQSVNSKTDNASYNPPSPSNVVSEGNEVKSDEAVRLNVGDREVQALITKGKPSNLVYFNMHDDEKTAANVARAFVKIEGGTFVELRHSGERLITFGLNGKSYKFDPNRIFTDAGIPKTLKLYGQTSPEAEKEVARFAKELIERFLDKAGVIVAMHNNTDGGFSAASYAKGGEYEKDTAEVFINPNNDLDDFFLVTENDFFGAIKTKDFNVVLQNNASVTDDGSLSVYCGRKGIKYVNVEAQHGHFDEQTRMLKELLPIISK
jgi:hypothetical protein